MQSSFKKIFIIFILFSLSLPLISALPVTIAVPASNEGVKKLKQWTYLIDYLESDGDLDINLVIAKDHELIRQGFRNKSCDFAFINPFWLEFWDDDLCSPVVKALVDNKDTYQSYLIVHKDSVFRKTEDLKDRSIAFTIPDDSAAGYYIPLSLLHADNLNAFRDFKEIIFSGTLLSILKGVSYGKLDSGFVTSSVFLEKNNSDYADNIRIISKSEPLPQSVLAARSGYNSKITEKIIKKLISMDKDPEGRKVLEKAGFSAFRQTSEEKYNQLKMHIEILENNNVFTE